MSSCVMLIVPKSEEIREYSQYRNSWLGAMHVWNELAKTYIGEPENEIEKSAQAGRLLLSGFKEVFDLLQTDNLLLIFEKALLASTCDKAMIKKENWPKFVKYLREWTIFRSDNNHYRQMATDIESLVESNPEDIVAICWIQTTVASDVWAVESGEKDEEGNAEFRWYDISKDEGHWFVFDELPELKG